jgi:hypothetical protein
MNDLSVDAVSAARLCSTIVRELGTAMALTSLNSMEETGIAPSALQSVAVITARKHLPY